MNTVKKYQHHIKNWLNINKACLSQVYLISSSICFVEPGFLEVGLVVRHSNWSISLMSANETGFSRYKTHLNTCSCALLILTSSRQGRPVNSVELLKSDHQMIPLPNLQYFFLKMVGQWSSVLSLRNHMHTIQCSTVRQLYTQKLDERSTPFPQLSSLGNTTVAICMYCTWKFLNKDGFTGNRHLFRLGAVPWRLVVFGPGEGVVQPVYNLWPAVTTHYSCTL